MSYAQKQMMLSRYQTFLRALDAAAGRSCSPDQVHFYQKYAARVAGMLAELEPVR